MRRESVALFAWVFLPAALAGPAADPGPPDTLPPGAKGKIVDLTFATQALKFTDIDLTFAVQDLGGKIQDVRTTETDLEVRIDLAADVLFAFDKADILPKAQAALQQVAALIRDKAKGTVRIEGHTDGRGSPSYNQTLSERRARAVKEWLTKREGLKKVNFNTQGFGATKPVVPNQKSDGSDDPEGRQKNRRVEIIVKK
jgi:outer membrane protein OmpA-like peptidoglycan-associated protein